MFIAFSPCLGHYRKTFARLYDRLVALVYGMTADFRYNEQKVLVFGKEQIYIPNRHTKVFARESAVKVYAVLGATPPGVTPSEVGCLILLEAFILLSDGYEQACSKGFWFVVLLSCF